MTSRFEALKKFLLESWDPLGLVGCDGAKNHYDPYAIRVFEMVREGADETLVAGYFNSILSSELGLKGDIGRDRNVAAYAIELCKF